MRTLDPWPTPNGPTTHNLAGRVWVLRWSPLESGCGVRQQLGPIKARLFGR